ncbi:MAG TPA: D-alanyl-D-alanine carboxypeptidase family protein [Rhizomicrobium sp.]|nr:D-alanyl-D-alanine carboxypeptidase family protein [Rhizomicrobium sp.]
MRRIGFVGLALFIGLALQPASAAISTTAEHALLMDGDTGQVLWAKDAFVPMPPASMSKLMTVEILFKELKDGRIKLSDKFPVSEAAWRTGGSKGFTRVGDHLTVEDLIQRIIVVSGNDACIVVAEALGGTTANFVAMMNARAKQLGLNQSHFVNPDGLPDPPGQSMSAFDLAKLARHLIYDYPQYYHFFSVKDYTTYDNGKPITQANRDLTLDKIEGADGLKTGHIDASGYGITASAKRDGHRMILVLNGLRYPEYNNDYFPNIKRSEEAGRIIDMAFREFRQYQLFKPGDAVGQAQVWGGTMNTVPMTVKAPLALTLQVDSRPGMKVAVGYDGPIKAPIVAGQKIGTLKVTAPDFPGLTMPLYAANDVPRAGIFGRMMLGISAFFSGTK